MQTLFALLQAQLLDSFFGVERGLYTYGETGAEISELISQLEARNPTAAPNEVLSSCCTKPAWNV